MKEKKIRGTKHLRNKIKKRTLLRTTVISALVVLAGVGVFAGKAFLNNKTDGIVVEKSVDMEQQAASGYGNSNGNVQVLTQNDGETGVQLSSLNDGNSDNQPLVQDVGGADYSRVILFDATNKVRGGIAYGTKKGTDTIKLQGSTDTYININTNSTFYLGNGYEMGDIVYPTVFVYDNTKGRIVDRFGTGADWNRAGNDPYRKSYVPVSGTYGNNSRYTFLISVNTYENAGSFDYRMVEVQVADTCRGMGNVSGGGRTNGSGSKTFTISATPQDDKVYEFDYWEYIDENGNTQILKGKTKMEITVTESNSYRMYTAHFKTKKYDLNYVVSGPKEGVKQVLFDPQSVTPGYPSRFTITMSDGYKLVEWSYKQKDKAEEKGTSNTGEIFAIEEDVTLYITVEDNRKTVKAEPSIINGGTISIKDVTDPAQKSANSVLKVPEGHRVSLHVTPNEDYDFIDWKDSEGVTYAGDTIEFVVDTDKSLIAELRKKVSKIVTLGNPSEGKLSIKYKYKDTNGVIKDGEGDSYGEYNVLTQYPITFTAKPEKTPSPGYSFVGVRDSNNVIIKPVEVGTDVVSLAITGDETYTAIFVEKVNNCKIYAKKSPDTAGDVEINCNNKNGTTTPINSGDSVNVDTLKSITIKATPKSGYKFARFLDENGSEVISELKKDGGVEFGELTFVPTGDTETFTAEFEKIACDITTAVSPKEAGKVKIAYTDIYGKEQSTENTGTVTIKADRPITLTAVPSSSKYKFSKFTDKYGKVYESNPCIIPKSDVDNTYTAVFVDNSCKITAVSSPEVGGYAKIDGVKAYEKVVTYGSEVKLLAVENDGYDFSYWSDQNGNKYFDAIITINAVNGDTKYTAYFVKEAININVKVEGGGPYSYVKFDNTYTDRNRVFENVERGTHSFEALADYGYSFIRWQTDDGKTYTDNPLSLGGIEKDITITAIFGESKCEIKVLASPVTGGTVAVNGKDGSDFVDINGYAVIYASPSPGYKFEYFTDSKNNRYEKEYYSTDEDIYLSLDNITGDETYTAHFVPTQLSLTATVAPDEAGLVKIDDDGEFRATTTRVISSRTNHTLHAESRDSTKYVFQYWQDSKGKTYTNNPLELLDIQESETYTAVFSSKDVGIKLLCSPASGGKITKTIDADGSVTAKVTANKGYTFICWKKGDVLITNSATLFVEAEKVVDGDVYTAYFSFNKDSGDKSDITEEKFYKDGRKDYGANYTTTKDSVRYKAANEMAQSQRMYADSAPGLKNYSTFASTRKAVSGIISANNVKTTAVATGSELSTVEGDTIPTNELKVQSSEESVIKDFVLNKYGDRYKFEILTMKKASTVSGFDNNNRTYLWKDTGAKEKDNIVIVYNLDEKKNSYITPIVDEDGILKFTIPELDNGEALAVVRVKAGKTNK